MPGAGTTRSGGLRRSLGVIGYRRIAITALLMIAGIWIGRFGWHLPLVVNAERAMYDIRSVIATPRIEQDPRIVLVTYTDETLKATGRRSPLDRGLLARTLTRLDAMHPRAIGIDILIDQPQPEDDELRAALKAMKTPTYLGLARAATNAESVQPWQEAFQQDFIASAAPGNVHAASVRIETDPDDVLRSWPERQQGDPEILADAMAGDHGRSIDFHRSIGFRRAKFGDIPVFNSLPIDTFDNAMAATFLTPNIEGRYIFIGGDITDADRFNTPATPFTSGDDQSGIANPRHITGLQAHATLLAQRLDQRVPSRPSSAMLWALVTVVILAAAAAGSRDFRSIGPLVIGAELAAVAVAPFALQAAGFDTQPLPAFGWLVGWTLAYSAASAASRGVGAEQRKFAQSALGRYLPPEIAREILRDPERLKLTGERRQIHALFSDIEGFTTMTHSVEPEVTASVLNRYLDRMSDIVLAHGGTIDKFVGDAIVAFWGAPFARDGDADMAARTAIAMADAGDAFAKEVAGEAVMGRTRVGVHHGWAIVGNFGGDGRIQYTALGDVMNTAARLEGANKKLKTRALISENAIAGTAGIGMMPMGRVAVRGRGTPITVFEPRPDSAAADIDAVADLVAAFDSGRADAATLKQFAETHVHDAAIVNLMYRLDQAGPGGFYALD